MKRLEILSIMKKIISVMMLFVALALTSCEFSMEPSSPIFGTFVNMSDQIVYFKMSGKTSDSDTLPEKPDTFGFMGSGIGTQAKPYEPREFCCPDKETRVEYLIKYPTIQLFVGYFQVNPPIVLKRYELTREWLIEHNWTIVYP